MFPSDSPRGKSLRKNRKILNSGSSQREYNGYPAANCQTVNDDLTNTADNRLALWPESIEVDSTYTNTQFNFGSVSSSAPAETSETGPGDYGEHFTCADQPAVQFDQHFHHNQSLPSQIKRLKWHEMPPQDDPILEQKRKRAVKGKMNREKMRGLERGLQDTINVRTGEVSRLIVERNSLQQVNSQLEFELQSLQECDTFIN
ncbi:hypothetical protein Hamer_G014151 [Homarus americanus]|uniref:Uncharacterized protein n=1 Tax=Homarus americanus TaxID=6706 RepID=A0A8J5JTM5_HOMAM|nr:hypothetical protein Hamer_G014151 [Homarus americanus]